MPKIPVPPDSAPLEVSVGVSSSTGFTGAKGPPAIPSPRSDRHWRLLPFTNTRVQGSTESSTGCTGRSGSRKLPACFWRWWRLASLPAPSGWRCWQTPFPCWSRKRWAAADMRQSPPHPSLSSRQAISTWWPPLCTSRLRLALPVQKNCSRQFWNGTATQMSCLWVHTGPRRGQSTPNLVSWNTCVLII